MKSFRMRGSDASDVRWPEGAGRRKPGKRSPYPCVPEEGRMSRAGPESRWRCVEEKEEERTRIMKYRRLCERNQI